MKCVAHTVAPAHTLSSPSHRPRRCADVDLQRWLVGAYAIPVVEEDEGDGDGDGEPDAK